MTFLLLLKGKIKSSGIMGLKFKAPAFQTKKTRKHSESADLPHMALSEMVISLSNKESFKRFPDPYADLAHYQIVITSSHDQATPTLKIC